MFRLFRWVRSFVMVVLFNISLSIEWVIIILVIGSASSWGIAKLAIFVHLNLELIIDFYLNRA